MNVTGEVTHQVTQGDRVYGWLQRRKGNPVTVCRRLSDQEWKAVNLLGKTHPFSDFRIDEEVWIDLVGTLHLAKITRFNSWTQLDYYVLFLDENKEVCGGTNCSLDQLVKLADWTPGTPLIPVRPNF